MDFNQSFNEAVKSNFRYITQDVTDEWKYEEFHLEQCCWAEILLYIKDP